MDGNRPSDERLFAEPAHGQFPDTGADLIRDPVHGVADAGVVIGDGVFVHVQAGFPDELDDPPFSQAGRPAAEHAAAAG